MDCIRGFVTQEEILNGISDTDNKKCDECPNQLYSYGILSCKLINDTANNKNEVI